MLNVRSFLKALSDNPPKGSRVGEKRLKGLVSYFDRLVKSNKKNVAERQHTVKQAKRKLLHSPATLKACLQSCMQEIPKVLCK